MTQGGGTGTIIRSITEIMIKSLVAFSQEREPFVGDEKSQGKANCCTDKKQVSEMNTYSGSTGQVPRVTILRRSKFPLINELTRHTSAFAAVGTSHSHGLRATRWASASISRKSALHQNPQRPA